MKTKKKLKKYSKNISNRITDNCCLYGVILIAAVIIASGFSGIEMNFFTNDITTTNNTSTNTSTNTNTDTETNTEPIIYKTFRARWDFIPILDVNAPTELTIGIYDSAGPTGVADDYATMEEELIWYSGVVGYYFVVGETAYVQLVDPGYMFAFLPDGLQPINADVIVGTNAFFDLVSNEQDWGDLWIEWI